MDEGASFILRSMRQEDLPAVAEIERETLSPWSPLALEQELVVSLGRQLVVELPQSGIIGWCACRKVAPEAELLKIAVSGDKKQQGFGTVLLNALLQELREQEYRALFLEVRSQNMPARQFYEKHRFRQIGLRPGYYSDPDDDALILQRLP